MTRREAIAKAKRIREELEKAREGAMIFAALVVLMTPVLLIGAGMLVLIVLMSSMRRGFDYEHTVWFMVIFLLFMLYTTWTNRGDAPPPFLAAGMVVGVAAVALLGPEVLSFRMTLGISGALTFGALALMGRNFHFDPSHHMGSGIGYDITPTEGGNIMLGCLSFLPATILTAYAEVFASTWIFKAIDDETVDAGVSLLQAAEKRAVDEMIHALTPAQARALELLKRANLVRIYAAKVRITERGRKLL